jgi:predicted amidohydrolase YtcJ
VVRVDFTVPEQDPYKVRKDKIKVIKVWATVLGGKSQPIK